MEEPITENTLFATTLPTHECNNALPWDKLIDPTGFPQQTVTTSKEEQLMNERKRCNPWGISGYQLCPKTGRVIFQTNGSLFLTHCGNQTSGFRQIHPNNITRANPIMSPTNPDLIAYFSNGNICVHDVTTNSDAKLTDLTDDDVDQGLLAGWPSYITQEEFDRYNGFWWCPVKSNTGADYILYEEVDASNVETIQLTANEHQKFPKAGATNTKSHLKIVEFEYSRPLKIGNKFDIYEHFPWCEYIVRVDWTPDGQSIWAFLLDRCQKRLEVIIIDRKAFFEAESFPSVQVIFREESDSWINVSNILHILKPSSGNSGGSGGGRSQSSVDFLISSEETGFRHLYYVKAGLNMGNQIPEGDEEVLRQKRLQPQILKKLALTSGDWSVSYHPIKVDEDRKLVFFHGFKDTPLEKHGYIVSINSPGHIRRLTELSYSHDCEYYEAHGILVTVFSNIENEAACQISKLRFPTNFVSDSNVDTIRVQNLGWLLKQRKCEMSLPRPKLLSHEISSGDRLYSIMYHPHNFDQSRKYPVVLNIYGGPDFQLVTNTFKGGKYVRNYLLSSLGYVVISIDSRGSANRGKAFESHIYKRLGQVELVDQLEVLKQMEAEFEYLDMTRMAINGWSYGGYLALRGISDFPHVFKCAVAGAPVTDWELYDTGYTERYMDVPENNPEGYAKGSVIRKASSFPDELRDRLLVAHGKLDDNVHFQHTERLRAALDRHHKPFRLQVYETERHSLRAMDASEHFETNLICFLANHL